MDQVVIGEELTNIERLEQVSRMLLDMAHDWDEVWDTSTPARDQLFAIESELYRIIERLNA